MRAALALLCCLLLAGCPEGKPPESAPTPPPAQVEAKESDPTAQTLREVVQARCLDPADPWALAHAVLVDGPELRLPGGDLAIERIVGDWLRRDAEGGLSFPRAVAGRPIEPHPGLFAKTLLEAGVPRTRAFALRGGGTATLGEIADALTQAYVPTATLALHNDAWLLEVAAATDPAGSKDLAARALKVLIENQAYLHAFQDDPTRTYSKPSVKVDGALKPAFIHQYYCGGLHLFQAVHRLHGTRPPPELIAEYERLAFRLEKETEYWDRTLAKVQKRYAGAELAGHRRVILAQKLKVQGHALETILRGFRAGLPKTPKAEAAVAAGFKALALTVRELAANGVYKDLDGIRASQPQLYLDLVGDSAHALHAFALR